MGELVHAGDDDDEPDGRNEYLISLREQSGFTYVHVLDKEGQLETSGCLKVDEGAARALGHGKSLLPAGVVAVSGSFSRGDAVAICDERGTVLGHGLVGYDSVEANLIKGARSDDLESLLGYAGRAALVHRDDMALVDTGATLAQIAKG